MITENCFLKYSIHKRHNINFVLIEQNKCANENHIPQPIWVCIIDTRAEMPFWCVQIY